MTKKKPIPPIVSETFDTLYALDKMKGSRMTKAKINKVTDDTVGVFIGIMLRDVVDQALAPNEDKS
jgi:hypothetical protein